MVTICSPSIYVERAKMLTLSRLFYLMLCRTGDLKIKKFLSQNHQKDGLLDTIGYHSNSINYSVRGL